MEYSIYINQEKAVEWKLTHSQAMLCDFYANEHSWVTTRHNDKDGDFLCIAYDKLRKELPFISSTSNDTFRKALEALVKKGLFSKCSNMMDRKIVYHRFNKKYAEEWRRVHNTESNPTYGIKSDIRNQIRKDTESNPYDTESNPLGDGMSSDYHNNQYHITNHNTDNHNNLNEEDDFSVLVKKEFDRILDIYPQTSNNTKKTIALAFGSFCKLKAKDRADVFKAVKNYSQTIQVKNHLKQNTTNFIKSLHTFITKSYTEFIYKLPEGYEKAEEFEAKNFPNGAKNPNAPESVSVYTQNGVVDITSLIENLDKARGAFEANGADFKIENYLEKEDAKIFSEYLGVEYFAKQTSFVIADTIIDYKEAM